jgi:hypothetical protein
MENQTALSRTMQVGSANKPGEITFRLIRAVATALQIERNRDEYQPDYTGGRWKPRVSSGHIHERANAITERHSVAKRDPAERSAGFFISEEFS